MDYKVIWDDEAIQDLARVVTYINQFNPMAARKTGETILNKVKLIGSFPLLGKIFHTLNREEVREVPVPPYRIIYHVGHADKYVRILKVWHGMRQEPEMR